MKRHKVWAEFDQETAVFSSFHKFTGETHYYSAKVGTLRYRRILLAIAYAALIQAAA
jgi:hypothetical protein